MGALQTYDVTVDWTGADERGTASYTSYSRDHEVRVEGKAARQPARKKPTPKPIERKPATKTRTRKKAAAKG